MFCINCGSEQKENLKFCSKCGTSLEVTQEEPLENQETVATEIPENLSLEGGNHETGIPTTGIGETGKKPVNYKLMSGVLALAIVFAMVFLFFVASKDGNENFLGSVGGASADEMRLEHFTGTITLENQKEPKAVVLGSRLVTGDNIETMIESNAFLVLDKSKVLRVNETSQIEIKQEDKKYDIHLEKGTVFFNVTATLTEEESLEFHTNNVVTGVRGTSGIIHYDANKQITQIVVLTGTVIGTTDSDEQAIEAGQMAIVETLEDGTTKMTIYDLEEDDPIYLFPDMFVDGMQGDLNNEGDSISLSEMVRLPKEVTLPSHIAVLGNSRTLSLEQASAYADYLNQSQATHVAFVDSGNNTLTMVAGTLDGYNLSAPDGRPAGTQDYIACNVVSWTGTDIITTSYTPDQSIKYFIKQNDTGFFLQSQVERWDTGITLLGYQDFPFSDSMLSQNPERMYLYVYSMMGNYADFYINNYKNHLLPEAVRNQFITESELASLAKYADADAITMRFELKDGTYMEATTFVEEVSLDLEDTTSLYWNSAQDVLPLLDIASTSAVEEESEDTNGDMPWISLYKPLLEEATAALPALNQGRTEEWDIYQTNYVLRDINGDGTPELFLNYQEGYVFTTSVYTVENGALITYEKTLWSGVASAGGSRGSLTIPEDGVGVYNLSWQSISPDVYTNLMTLNNGVFTSTSLEIDDWTATVPLYPSSEFVYDTYDTSDFSGLNWTGNG